LVFLVDRSDASSRFQSPDGMYFLKTPIANQKRWCVKCRGRQAAISEADAGALARLRNGVVSSAEAGGGDSVVGAGTVAGPGRMIRVYDIKNGTTKEEPILLDFCYIC